MNHYAMRGGSLAVMEKAVSQSIANGWTPISTVTDGNYQTVIFKTVTNGGKRKD